MLALVAEGRYAYSASALNTDKGAGDRAFYGCNKMKKLQIAVGIIRNPNDEIFITRRAADAYMANAGISGRKIEADGHQSRR